LPERANGEQRENHNLKIDTKSNIVLICSSDQFKLELQHKTYLNSYICSQKVKSKYPLSRSNQLAPVTKSEKLPNVLYKA